MNIREVAISTKMSEQAIRTAIRKGSLKTTKVPFNDTQFKHEISEDAVKEWRANSGAHNSRADGRRKMLLYVSEDELKTVKALLVKANLKDVADLIKVANKSSK